MNTAAIYLASYGATHLRRCASVLLLALIAACSSNPTTTIVEPEPTAPPVGAVTAQYATPLEPLLDLSITVFDQGIDATTQDGVATQRREQVFPTVRKAESLLIPVTLSQFVEATGAWGVVRVVHSPDVQMPVRVEGEILRSDGEVLELQVRVFAADGRQLLDRAYRDETEPEDYPVARGSDPFADIYRAISNDLIAVAGAINAGDRLTLQRLSEMRFAADLAPGGFGRFIDEVTRGSGADSGALEDAGVRYALASYPSDNDPMLARLQRIRRQDELFIDSVDERYSGLYDQVAESYALWRQYSFELRRYGVRYRASAAERKRKERRGSYAAMQQVYASFRKVKIQEEDLREVVKGFTGESLETVLEVDDSVFRLSGSVENRYDEWRQILGRIYGLEYGLE